MRTFLSFAFLLISAISFAQQKVVPSMGFYVTPSLFSSSNKAILQFEEDDQLALYDENIDLIRQIPLSEHKFRYSLTYNDMKREVKKVNAEIVKQRVYYTFYENFTFEDYLEREIRDAGFDFTIVTKEISDHETMIYSTSVHYDYSMSMFFGYSVFGNEYPRCYMIYNSTENILYQYDVKYTVEYTDWTNQGTRTESYEIETPIVDVIYHDIDASSCYYGMIFKASQTLFNDDDQFEYIIPKVTITENSQESEISTSIPNNYGNAIVLDSTTCTTEKQYPIFTGFQVISSDGSVIHDIDFGENYVLIDYSHMEARVMKIGDNIYLAADCIDRSAEKKSYCTIFYRIDRNTSSVKMMKVTPRKMTVRSNNSDIHVTMTSEDSPSKLVLTDAKGITVASKNIPSGVSSTTISSTNANGIYNLSRIINGKVIDNAKVLLK